MRKAMPTLALTLLALCACADGTDPLLPTGDPTLTASVAPVPTTISAPVFGLATAPDGSLLAAETSAGVTELRLGTASPVSSLPGVAGIDAVGRGDVFAVTWGDDPSDPAAQKLYRVSRGHVDEIADLGAYEETMNPDQIWNPKPPNSNPFNVARLAGGKVLVADAAANAILVVDDKGTIDWVAVLTPHAVSTAGVPIPNLPPTIMAEPVSTSIAIGPDGDYYAGELTGFPGTPGNSRIWRIAAGSRHVLCPSSACTEVAGGLTSIMDLEFGPDGTLYVAEFDAASWLAVEGAANGGPLAPVAGGVVMACDVGTGACSPIATGLGLVTALTVGKDGRVWVADNSSIPGNATIRPVN